MTRRLGPRARAPAMALAAVAACSDGGSTKFPDAAPAADADLTVDAAPARETIATTLSLAVGELAEGIMTGGSSDFALIHLEAPVAEMDWNIHAHPGGMIVTVYEELDRMTVDYRFVPSTVGDWYLLVRNSGLTNMDVKVRVGLYGALAWRWQ